MADETTQTTGSQAPYILQDTEGEGGSLQIPRNALDSFFAYWEENEDLRKHFETGTDDERLWFGIMDNLVQMGEVVGASSETEQSQAKS